MKPYQSIRSQIKSGDVITWRGRGPVSWLIQRWTHRSHASICLDSYNGDGGKYLIEAWDGEFNIRLLSRRLQGHLGQAFWHRLRPELDQFRGEIETQSLALLGTKYDYQSLFANMMGRVNVNAERLFCSEAICHIFLKTLYPELLRGYRGSQYANMLIDGVALRPGGIARLPLFLDEIEIEEEKENGQYKRCKRLK